MIKRAQQKQNRTSLQHHKIFTAVKDSRLFLFYISFSSVMIFVLFFVLFLFTFDVIFGIVSFIFIMIVLIVLVAIMKLTSADSSNNLRSLIAMYKQKDELMQKRELLQEEFMKHRIDAKKFEAEIDNLNARIFDFDFKIEYFNSALSLDKEFSLKLNLLHKKYLKRELSETLYNQLVFDIKKEQTYSKVKHT